MLSLLLDDEPFVDPKDDVVDEDEEDFCIFSLNLVKNKEIELLLVAVNDEDAAADDWMMYNDVLSQQVLFYLTILTFCKICTFYPIKPMSNLHLFSH